MAKRPDLSALIEPLYRVLDEPRAWTTFVDMLSHEYSSTIAVLVGDSEPTPFSDRSEQPITGQRSSLSFGRAPFARLALWPILVNVRPSAIDVNQKECCGSPQVLRSVLFADEAFAITLIAKRGRGMEAFSSEEVATWQRLTPHLHRMVQMLLQSWQAALGTESAFAALDALGVGILVVGHDGWLVFASTVAEQILARTDGLIVVQGRLRVPVSVRGQFEEHLRLAAVDIGEGLSRAAGVIVIPCASGPPISMLMMPVEQKRLPSPLPVAAIVLHDPSHSPCVRDRDLSAAYGLTRAEGRLVRELIRGIPLAQYAGGAGIAVNTAKTYLHQVLTKMGQSRQADLMRAVLADPILQMAGHQGGREEQKNDAWVCVNHDTNSKSRQWRSKAEELRTIADQMTFPRTKEAYRRMAANYCAMAERLEARRRRGRQQRTL